MRSHLGKIRRVYRQEGLGSLTKQAVSYTVNQSILRAREITWRLRGDRAVAVGGVRTSFFVGNLIEARGLRFLVDQERVVLEDVLTEVGPDDVFYDVGANIGFFTCFVAARCRVVAFEPAPPNARRIRENLVHNGRDATVLELALADEPGTGRFDRAARAPGYPFAGIGDESAPADTFEVDVETGDRLIERETVPQPTVVKIDVEGAEPLVIDGMRTALGDEQCRLVYCEIHREAEHDPRERSIADFGSSEAALTETLTGLGFRVSVLLDRGNEVYLKGEK